MLTLYKRWGPESPENPILAECVAAGPFTRVGGLTVFPPWPGTWGQGRPEVRETRGPDVRGVLGHLLGRCVNFPYIETFLAQGAPQKSGVKVSHCRTDVVLKLKKTKRKTLQTWATIPKHNNSG